MFRFDIDINPIIDGKECHLEGFCDMLSDDTFRVTMTSPFAGLSVTKTFDDSAKMDMLSTFATVEKDLTQLYINRIQEDTR